MGNQFEAGETVHLLYPLCEAVAYPGSSFLDMVFCVLPASSGRFRTLRLWLRTPAAQPEVQINARRFSPADRSPDGQWIDFGRFAEDPDGLGIPKFGVLRFFGMTVEEARESWCLLTSQVDVEMSGSVEAAEERLQGIKRADVGASTLCPARVEVGTKQVFTMSYRCGDQGLPRGAYLRLAFAKAFSHPQTENPQSEGWLAPASPEAVRLLSIDTSAESHERVDAIYRLERDLSPGETVEFRYRTGFVYLFPQNWTLMERRYWWSHLPVMAPAVAVDERKVFVAPLERHGHGLWVEPGPAERLFLFLPGRIKQGAAVRLAGVFTDRYRNVPAYSPLPSDVELRLEGSEDRGLGSPEKRFTHWYRFEVPIANLAPGVYRVSAVRTTDKTVLARSNPMEILGAGEDRLPICWGEIHAHSEQSDGSGDYREMFVHAQECGNLDFAAAADHACYHSDNEWQWMQDVVNAQNCDHRFVTLLGYEWAGRQGHRNVYTWKQRLDLFRGMTPGQKTLDAVYDHFDGNEDVVAAPHVHHTSDFYDQHNPHVQRFMEIYSMWGNYETLAFDVLNKGARIGFTGGGDCHEGRCGFSVEDPDGQGTVPHTFAPKLTYRCGLTAARLPRLTRAELVEALRERRTYATTGARILLDVAVSGVEMGQEGRVDGPALVHVRAYACDAIRRVDVIRQGVVVHTEEGLPEDAAFAWSDEEGEGGWYVVRVEQEDGQKAWSSPIWVNAPQTAAAAQPAR